MPRYPLHGKSVIVTGAAGGIGAATVEALVAKGAQVTLVDLAQEAVDGVAAALPAEQVLARAADVTDVDHMTAVTAAAVERFGKVDVVFANAGIANNPPTTLAQPIWTPTSESSKSTCSAWCAPSSPPSRRSSRTTATS